MNNRLLGAGIGIIFIVGLIFVAVGIKKDDKGIKAVPQSKTIQELIAKDKLDEAKKLIDDISNSSPNLSILWKFYFDLANSYEKKNDIVKARDICEIILNKYQNIDNISEVQEKVGALNMKILFSSLVTDRDVLYKVEPGDTLSKIAKRFGTTVDLIKLSNSLKSDMIRAGSKLKVSKTRYKIFIDKSENILKLLSDTDTIVKVYRVSTGENNSTPVGTFKIVNKVENPVWYTQGVRVPAESPDNILGSRWLGFSETGYGIHGTTEPESLGRQTTKGCIRMLTSEVEELYTIVPVGTKVSIVD